MESLVTTQAVLAKAGWWHTLSRVAVIRLIVFFVVLREVYQGVQYPLEAISKMLPDAFLPPVMLAATAFFSFVMLGLYVLLVRLFERRAATELSFRGRGGRLAALGALFGFLLFCLIYGVLFVLGVAHWGGRAGFGGALIMLIIAIISGIGEELAYRGGFFRIVEESMGTLVAIILSAALFAYFHTGNPGATAVSTIAIALEAGVLLAATYVVSRNLWLPIGLHFRLELYRRRRVRRDRLRKGLSRHLQGPAVRERTPDRRGLWARSLTRRSRGMLHRRSHTYRHCDSQRTLEAVHIPPDVGT